MCLRSTDAPRQACTLSEDDRIQQNLNTAWERHCSRQMDRICSSSRGVLNGREWISKMRK